MRKLENKAIYIYRIYSECKYITFTQKTQVYIYKKGDIYMSESVKDGNYFLIPGWMTHPQMGLKGVELKLFAIIYCHSQGPGQECTVSIDYLAQLSGASARSVINSIRSLNLKGYIYADEIVKNKEYKLCAADIDYHNFEKIEGRRVKAHAYFAVFGWMAKKNRLGLKDLELLIYAQVYALSQNQPCSCGTKYLANITGASERAVRYTLVNLTNKGLLRRKAVGVNRYVYYAIVPKALEKISDEMENISAPLENISAPWKKLPTYNKSNNKLNNKRDNRPKNQFNNFDQRAYSFDQMKAIEEKMLC